MSSVPIFGYALRLNTTLVPFMEKSDPVVRDSHDPLTGLLDRTAFRALLEAECERSARNRHPFGLIFFDIDRFKVVNYGYGVEHGDALLISLANLAHKMLRGTGYVGRWGGQEFLCLLPNTDKNATDKLAEQLRRAIETAAVHHTDVELHATASFGTACYPEDGDSSGQLLAALGAALHQAKASGRNRVVPASKLRPQLFGVGRMLSQALQEGRVVPAFQPIVELKSGKIVADEALARIVSPSHRVIPASAFIDAARELQLSHQIDRSILLQTFAHCVATLQRNETRAHFVNISGNLLRHPDIVAELLTEATRHCDAFDDHNGPGKLIVIEVTERELVEDLQAAHKMLKPFLDFGIRLALDDFGSGYSSFKYLADLPFSFLKIEGSLIRRVTEPRVRTIVQGIQRTATDLGLISLAEYIEDEQIADIVREIGIDWGQGYHFGKPALLEQGPHIE
jgi:diguanylate cyclase (GGDEF)-like protein